MKVAASKPSAQGAEQSFNTDSPTKHNHCFKHKGFTLIETVITISIIAIAMTGIIAVWSNATAKGADPFWQVKIETLSKVYLDRISTTAYDDLTNLSHSNHDFNQQSLHGYQGFGVLLTVEFAGEEFSLTQNSLKKTTINITSPLGNQQQFVTYRGDWQ